MLHSTVIQTFEHKKKCQNQNKKEDCGEVAQVGTKLKLINNPCLNLFFRSLFHVIFLIPRYSFVFAMVCVVVIVSQQLCS